MNEVIASILDAEKKADEIVKSSLEKSKAVRQAADSDGEKIKNGAVAVFKLHRVSAIKEAEKKAASEYDKILEEGKSAADKILADSADKAEYFADKTVKNITG
nr:hypothetical protein [Clostridia bacterium]